MKKSEIWLGLKMCVEETFKKCGVVYRIEGVFEEEDTEWVVLVEYDRIYVDNDEINYIISCAEEYGLKSLGWNVTGDKKVYLEFLFSENGGE